MAAIRRQRAKKPRTIINFSFAKNTRPVGRVFFMSNFFALQESGNTIGKNSVGAVLR